MNTEDDNEPVKTRPANKPHVNIGTIGGHRPNLTMLIAMTAAMSMPTGGGVFMPRPAPPKPPTPDDDSVV